MNIIGSDAAQRLQDAVSKTRIAPHQYLNAGPATYEVEDQDDHGHNQEQVYERAADASKQSEKPKNRENDGNPKQHDGLP